MSLIELKNVTKAYGEESRIIKALDQVDLNIEAGKVVTIMGPSGSGKTTLLNLIGAMDDPSSGEIYVNNTEIGSLPESKLAEFRKKVIGFVFQNYYLLPNIDVIGNVLMPLVPYRITQSDKRRAVELLNLVGLGDRIHSKVGKLSGGESQRVAIARALINDPDVILADEPTGNLDSKTGQAIVELLLNLTDKGKTVIIVTHDPRIAKMVVERPSGKNLWINDGRLIDKPDKSISDWTEDTIVSDITENEYSDMTIELIMDYILKNFTRSVLGEIRGERGLFYNEKNLLPQGTSFLLIKEKDTKTDKYSNLNREGVFRLSLNISKESFTSLFGKVPEKDENLKEEYDFSVLNHLFPHPVYGSSMRICILNPSKKMFDKKLLPLIQESYEIARKRFNKRVKK
jgi:putative ABC transport system ATP-binding protein